MSEQKIWNFELRDVKTGNIEGYDKITGTYSEAKQYADEWLSEMEGCEIVIIDAESEEIIYQGK